MIVSYAAPDGRRVLFADANPAIGALRVSTLTSLPEMKEMTEVNGWNETNETNETDDVNESLLRPNLGPPPPRPDWRRGRQS
jgi:hypothetical protein